MPKNWYSYFVTVDSGDSGSPDTEPNKAPSAAQTVAEIARSIQTPRMPEPPPALPNAPAQAVTQATPTAQPGATLANFDEVYQLAEIQAPVHGFTVFKIAHMLESQHIRNLPVEVKRSSVLLALEAAGVKLDEIIQDAVRRDKALDAYELVQKRAVDQAEAAVNEKNRKLQEEMDRNSAQIRQTRERFEAWRKQKQQEEQRIAAAVAPFVTENPVTTS